MNFKIFYSKHNLNFISHIYIVLVQKTGGKNMKKKKKKKLYHQHNEKISHERMNKKKQKGMEGDSFDIN